MPVKTTYARANAFFAYLRVIADGQYEHDRRLQALHQDVFTRFGVEWGFQNVKDLISAFHAGLVTSVQIQKIEQRCLHGFPTTVTPESLSGQQLPPFPIQNVVSAFAKGKKIVDVAVELGVGKIFQVLNLARRPEVKEAWSVRYPDQAQPAAIASLGEYKPEAIAADQAELDRIRGVVAVTEKPSTVITKPAVSKATEAKIAAAVATTHAVPTPAAPAKAPEAAKAPAVNTPAKKPRVDVKKAAAVTTKRKSQTKAQSKAKPKKKANPVAKKRPAAKTPKKPLKAHQK